MEKGIVSWQNKAIHALASGLALIDKEPPHNDPLHEMIYSRTGKTSIKDLTQSEADSLIGELKGRMYGNVQTPPRSRQSETCRESAGMTIGQQNKVWEQMHKLADLDKEPSSASLGARVSGIIRHDLHQDATAEAPFKWLDCRKGSKLIEIVKNYVANANPQNEKGQKVKR